MATIMITFALLITVLVAITGASKAQLSPNFYSSTCPRFFAIVRNVVRVEVSREARMGASLLRLHYVDCFVNGCDASVLLDDNATFTGEKNAGTNMNSLRGFEVIDAIKARLESECPGVASCADILTVAARDAVVNLGGPNWSVAVGRRDSTIASAGAATSQLPGPYMNRDNLTSAFSQKGLTVRNMVALSGAHTLGRARCASFRDRIYNESDIDPQRANGLKRICPVIGGDNNTAPLDAVSPTNFDNNYFSNLVIARGLLHSDQQLFGYGGPTDRIVTAYSRNPTSFMNDFARAMVKMSSLSPLTGTNGQIRRDCRMIN